jgi:Mn2+/Fe2+ NRAMP family transporter
MNNQGEFEEVQPDGPVVGEPIRPYESRTAVGRERIRGIIALILVLALLVNYVLLWVALFGNHLGTIDTESVKDALALTFSPLVGLVGAATGFYFGEKAR